MPRRSRALRREIPPDTRYGSVAVAQFTNKITMRGKKSLAERIMNDSFKIIEERTKKNPFDIFEQAVKNATPILEVKPRRVGGATYQVPIEIRPERRNTLAMRWLIRSARARSGRSMAERLAAELTDASQGTGTTIKRREDTHRMAEANKAFAHYRW